MMSRVLPMEEWGRLRTGGVVTLLPYVDPRNIDIAVVEDEYGDIVASLAAVQVTHIEGAWIEPKYRKHGGVMRGLLRAAYSVPRARGEKWVVSGTQSKDSEVNGYLERLGGHRLPGVQFLLPIDGVR